MRPAPARILADVGGMHARFTRQNAPGEALTDFVTLEVRAVPAHRRRVRHAHSGGAGVPHPECAIAIATAVSGDHVRMTNLVGFFSTEPWFYR